MTRLKNKREQKYECLTEHRSGIDEHVKVDVVVRTYKCVYRAKDSQSLGSYVESLGHHVWRGRALESNDEFVEFPN